MVRALTPPPHRRGEQSWALPVLRVHHVEGALSHTGTELLSCSLYRRLAAQPSRYVSCRQLLANAAIAASRSAQSTLSAKPAGPRLGQYASATIGPSLKKVTPELFLIGGVGLYGLGRVDERSWRRCRYDRSPANRVHDDTSTRRHKKKRSYRSDDRHDRLHQAMWSGAENLRLKAALGT